MRVLLTSGLSNRLRTIVGFWYLHEKYQIPVEIFWIIDDNCNGYFTDIFKSIDCRYLTLIECEFNTIQLRSFDFFGQMTTRAVIEKFEKSFSKKETILSSKELMHIEDKYYSKIIPLKKYPIAFEYNAVHIRRTDFTEKAIEKNVFISNDVFDNFIKKSDIPVFIATDNAETQNRFENVFFFKIIPSDNVRQTSLKDALRDIYICSNAINFQGSEFSSFTDLIKIYRRINKKKYF